MPVEMPVKGGLLLSLQEGDSVFLSGGIAIQVTKTQGSRATIRFVAPKDVKILREGLKNDEN